MGANTARSSSLAVSSVQGLVGLIRVLRVDALPIRRSAETYVNYINFQYVSKNPTEKSVHN